MPGSISRRQTNTRRALALLALLPLGAAAPLGAAPPRARAVELLAPRFFPVWQARNVAFPFVTFDAGAGLYRMYYAGSAGAQLGDSAWDQWMMGLVTSRDGRTWRMPDDYEPVLRPWRFATGESTARARRERFDAMGAFGACVLRERGRHLLWYTGWNGDDEPAGPGKARPVHHRIGFATSADGAQWRTQAGDAGQGAVLGLGAEGTYDSHAAGQPFVVSEPGGYRMWYEAFDGRRRRIASARSADGVAWTREGVALEPGGPGAPDEEGARNPIVLKRRARWELWYQGRGGPAPGVHVLRATSEDARTWTKAAVPVALPLAEPLRAGESLHADSVIVAPDGSCRVFFARERTLRRGAAWGPVESRSFHIYSAAVDP